MRLSAFFLIFLCSTFFSLLSFAQDGIELPSPFVLDGRYKGEVSVMVVDNRYVLDKSKFIALLKESAAPEVIERIRRNQKNRIDLNAVSIKGLRIKYREETLSLHIDVEPSYRRVNQLSIYSVPYLASAGKALMPSPWSGYLNVRTNSLFTDGHVSSNQFSSEFETVLNFHQWVYESQIDYRDSRQQQWQFFQQSLTHDDEKRAIRYIVGDLDYATVGLQNFLPFAGFSVSKRFAIQPYKITNPVGNQRFFLKQPSKVRILLNGQVIREFNLPAGEQNIRDLPLARGLNDLVIEIEDAFGRIERIRSTQLSESELLQPGIQEFSYNLGVDNPQKEFTRTYVKDSPRYSLFHRFGLPHETTVGLNLQGSDEQWMGGTELLWGSAIGFWAVDFAASGGERFDPDTAGRLRYRLTKRSLKSSFSWSWAWDLNVQGKHFAALGNLLPNNSLAWSYETVFTFPTFISDLRMSVGFNYDHLREELRDRKEALLQMNYFGFQGHQLTFEASIGENEFTDENRFFINWIWTGNNAKDFYLSSYDSTDNSVSLESHRSYHPSVGQMDLSASARSSDTQKSLEGSFDYFNQRVLILSDFKRFFDNDNDGVDGQANITVGSAIAFAGGHWSLSRPIVDSFALLAAKPHLHGQRIPVNSQGDFTEAEIGTWKTAVLPNLTAYHYYPVFLDPSHLEEGYGLEEENLLLKPAFRSGFSLTVGTDASVFIIGRLIDSHRKPLSLAAGKLISRDHPGVSYILFTNRKGEFYVEGVRAGHWALKLDNSHWQPVNFTVSEEKTGKLDLGQIKMREVE